jgi:glycosyltransferase involved in cell wall biosynthesis
LKTLIETFGLIKDDVPHDLVIVGRREGFITGDETVVAEAATLGDRVRFTGYVGDDLLRQYFAHADALVLPSLYEGFGLPPLEAMACRCPVIVSNAASLPEVCGDAALYCDPHDPTDIADKIRQLTNDMNLQDALRQRGLERAKQFTWEKCAQETLAVIREVLREDQER